MSTSTPQASGTTSELQGKPQTFDECIADIIPRMFGWCSVEKAQHLAKLVLDHKPRLCVEIGVMAGRSLIPVALACRVVGGFAVGIDPWGPAPNMEGWPEGDVRTWWGAAYMEPYFLQAQSIIGIYELQNYCALLRTKSDRALIMFADGTIDFLHIDGNHSEEVSQRDVAQYMPKLKIGGLLVFDDADWPSTQAAVRIVESQCDLVEDRTTYRVYRRVR